MIEIKAGDIGAMCLALSKAIESTERVMRPLALDTGGGYGEFDREQRKRDKAFELLFLISKDIKHKE